MRRRRSAIALARHWRQWAMRRHGTSDLHALLDANMAKLDALHGRYLEQTARLEDYAPDMVR